MSFGYTILGFGAGILDSFKPFISKAKPDGSSSTDGNSYGIHLAFDDNTKGVFAVVWRNNDDTNLKAVVGTHTDGAIVFGTPVVIHSQGDLVTLPRMDFDNSTAGKFVVQYNLTERHNAGNPTFRVGTISNTGVNATISFGSASTMPYGPAHPNSTWHAAQGDIAVSADGSYVYFVGYDQSSANQGRMSRWDLGSTSVSGWNYIGQFHANGRAQVLETCIHSDDNDSVFLLYTQNGANLMTRKVSPNNLNSDQQVTSNGAEDHGMTVNPNSKQDVLYYYRDQANSDYPTVRMGRWSGASCSFGTAVVLESADTGTMLSASFDHGTAKDQAVVLWGSDGSTGKAGILEVDGTSITVAETQTAAGTINDGVNISSMGNEGRAGVSCDPQDIGKFIYPFRHYPGSGQTDHDVPFVACGSFPSA